MYLKSLELHGFKSFPDKTVLNFDKGSTIIVGPNGSGKSNITDAIRWVLGEISNKNIRGTKLEDVVFVGAESHRPMSFAEVSITFDDTEEPKRLNCPYEEVTVTRRYFKTGDSEYLINRKPCRLKDIHELFMNTGVGREGYSIVGQGKIAEIISKKSEERRGIFEETAGISRFRYQKNESEKKLRETEENVSRATDIFSELDARIGPLSKDAEKARTYLDLYEEKKELDITLWIYDLKVLTTELARYEEDFRITENELNVINDDEEVLLEQYNRLFEASQESKKNESELYEQIKDINARLHGIDASISEMEKGIVHTNALIDATTKSLEKANSDSSEEYNLVSLLKEKVESFKTNIDEITEKLKSEYKKKDELLTLSSEYEATLEDKYAVLREKESERDELRVRCDALKMTLDDDLKKEDTVNSEVTQYKEKIAELESSIADSKNTISGFESKLDEYYGGADSFDKEILSLNDQIAVANTENNSLVASHEALSSRISAMESMLEHFEGYSNSVKFIMNESQIGSVNGIHGPISQLIKVDSKYVVALETAFGSSLQNIVVDTEKDAKAAIYALKQSGSGRATFYPISNVKPQDRTHELLDAAKSKGFIGYADDLLKTDSKYKDIISSIVGRTAIFDNIDNATDVAKENNWKVKIVTLDGQQINIGGSFTGGSVKRDSGMLSRSAQIESLKKEKDKISDQIKDSESILSKLNDKVKSLTDKQNAYLDNAKITESLLRSERQTLDELEANHTVVNNLIIQLVGDSETLRTTGAEKTQNVSEMESTIEELSKEILDITTERQELYITKNETDDSIISVDETINTFNIELAGVMKDAENAQNSVDDAIQRVNKFKSDVEAYNKEIEDLKASIADSEQNITTYHENAVTLRDSLTELESKRSELIEGNSEFDLKLNDNRIKTKEITDRKEVVIKSFSLLESKIEKLKNDKEKITSRMWDEYELTLTAAFEINYPEITEEDKREKSKRQNELKSIVKSLGNVNIGAIDEYVAVKERYDYLKSQLDDLNNSKKELEGIIASINGEMERIFSEVFEKINYHFGETFKELFGGGNAQLELTTPDNVLESGVEIRVAPPGKMIKSLSLLSGGEQAFVAIALIFALIKVNPSPFCIFDEIEAALDEVNVTRVANYVKRLSKEMQIILITHRRGTMETADTLYGVTMPQHGVSKVFTLDVNAVSKDSQIARKFTE